MAQLYKRDELLMDLKENIIEIQLEGSEQTFRATLNDADMSIKVTPEQRAHLDKMHEEHPDLLMVWLTRQNKFFPFFAKQVMYAQSVISS
jgi:hypothetical protein